MISLIIFASAIPMSEFLQKLYFFVLNPSGLCLLYRSSQVWTNPTWSSSALSWPRKGQARPFGSLCPSLINRDGKDIDHDFDSQDSWWPFRARSSRLASVAIVRQTSHLKAHTSHSLTARKCHQPKCRREWFLYNLHCDLWPHLTVTIINRPNALWALCNHVQAWF